MKLIYHNNKSANEVSPFDVALLQVSNQANPLYLASPYIGLSFLNRILDNADDWKLLSDVEAWLSSGNRKHRAKCWQFILENLDRIKHVPDLHAKVAIGNNLLFLGSANFTDKGVLGRDELSILIDDQKLVNESLGWFHDLWNTASAPVIDEGDELVKTLDELQWTAPRSRIKLSSSAVKVKSILATSARPSGFDVASSFAKSSLSESFNLLPLEEAYQKISDDWFSSERSFTFKELLDVVTKHQPATTKYELWSLVIRETVNHWLGGLFIDGFDRYVYEDGKFDKWGNSKLASVIEIDNLLKFVIETIDRAPKTSHLPFEDKWLELNVPEHHILTIVDQLINVGLLIEIDNAGELEMYSIDTEFEWPKRWQKFTQSFNAFKNKIVFFKVEDDDLNDIDEDFKDEVADRSSFMDSLEANFEASKVKTYVRDEAKSKLVSEVHTTARELGLTPKELIELREQSLISAFNYIQEKEYKLIVTDIEFLYGNFISKNNSRKLKATFRDYRHGPFITKKFLLNKIAAHKSNDSVVINKDWLAINQLSIYPKALKKWLELSVRIASKKVDTSL